MTFRSLILLLWVLPLSAYAQLDKALQANIHYINTAVEAMRYLQNDFEQINRAVNDWADKKTPDVNLNLKDHLADKSLFPQAPQSLYNNTNSLLNAVAASEHRDKSIVLMGQFKATFDEMCRARKDLGDIIAQKQYLQDEKLANFYKILRRQEVLFFDIKILELKVNWEFTELWNEQNNTSGPIGEVAAANIETDKMVISVKNVFRALSDNRPGDLKQRVSEINVSLRVIEGLMTKWPQSKQYLADDVVQVRASVMDFLNGVQQYSLNNPIPESFTWYGKEYYFHNEKILALCNSKTGVIEAVNKFKLNSGIFALPASKEPPMFKSRVAEVYDEQKDRKMPTPEEMMKLIEKRKNETADKGAKSFSTNIKKEEIKAGQTFEMDKLYFDADSTNINPGSTKALDELYDFLVKNPKVTIEVGGHTNNLPPEDYCDLLSEKRAKSVAQYIIKKGISEQRVSFKGYGKRQPIATNETSGGRKRNQRVEVKIIKVE